MVTMKSDLPECCDGAPIIPNAETIAAMRESQEQPLETFHSIEEFLAAVDTEA